MMEQYRQRKEDVKNYPGYKAMDCAEIWRGELLSYIDAIGSRII